MSDHISLPGVGGTACAVPSRAAAGQAPRTWKGPNAAERLAILRRAKSIAIVGASNNPARASFFVATYLLSRRWAVGGPVGSCPRDFLGVGVHWNSGFLVPDSAEI